MNQIEVLSFTYRLQCFNQGLKALAEFSKKPFYWPVQKVFLSKVFLKLVTDLLFTMIIIKASTKKQLTASPKTIYLALLCYQYFGEQFFLQIAITFKYILFFILIYSDNRLEDITFSIAVKLLFFFIAVDFPEKINK